MPRDYYGDRRYRGETGRSYDPEYDARNYGSSRRNESQVTDRDTNTAHARNEKEPSRDYYDSSRVSKDTYPEEHVRHFEEKRPKHKKSKRKKRPKDQERDDKRKSLVAAYDDISSDSDTLQSTSNTPASPNRGRKTKAEHVRAKSPSTAIKEYKRIKERSHSNSPAVREKTSPHRGKSSKSSRLASPESSSKKESSKESKYSRVSSPYVPSPKKARYRSRTPSPQR